MKITFNEHTFEIATNKEGLFSLKDIEKGWQQSGGKGKRLENWKRSEDYEVLSLLREFHVVNERVGKSFVAYGNKFAVIEYASHCSLAFRVAVNQAFEALMEGRHLDAGIIAGKVAIDEVLCEKVTKEWTDFCSYIHPEFKVVHKNYGSNFTRLIVKTISGYPNVGAVQGNADANLVERLIEQNHGEALQALSATLALANNLLSSKVVQTLMQEHEGRKMAYSLLKETLGS